MRSIWKGHIRFSLVTIPIQVFNAVETKGNISFKQLHSKDNGSVGYDKVCRHCDEKVPREEIVKGYEYEPDQYVIIESEDLKKIKLKSTRAIEIEAFVDVADVHPSRYEGVYYVGPEGEIANKTYILFRETLKKSGKAGIGRIILRDREDVMMIVPYGDGLVMYKLRFPYEIRDINKVPDLPKEEKIDKDQLKLAETLVNSLSTDFAKVDFEDRYRDALLDMVNAKVEGKEIVTMSDEETAAPVVDIMSALKESIAKAKGKKSA